MSDTSPLDVGLRTGALDRLRAALADRYALEGEIGRGGMSTVFLARDLRHSRRVAVKVLSPSLGSAAGVERFTREIAVAARLQHPHILPLHDSGEIGGLLFYVMPYVEGESLRDRLERERRLPVDDTLRIAGEVADALGYAHAQGVVHRDIKPENILLSGYPPRPSAAGSWHALVADFGIARALGGIAAGRITSAGMVLGTPAYMSPEQAAGDHDVDGRSDIYSLACVLYEMLAGSPPFTGPNAQVVVARHISDAPAPLRTLRPDLPERVERAIMRALEKVPSDRYDTAEELGRALRWRGSRRSRAHAPARGGGARRWVAALGAAAALAAGMVVLPRLGTYFARAPALDASLFVVLPFEHRDGAAPVLLTGDQCERLLYGALSYWRDLKLVSPLRVSDLHARGEPARLTVDRAIAQAAGLGAGRLVWGEVWEFDDTVRVHAVLYDVARRDQLAERTVRFPRDGGKPGAAFDDLAAGLLARDADPGTPALRHTQSYAAWAAYDGGLAAAERWDLAGADSAFRAALALDPEFAQAHLWRARVLGWSGRADETDWREAVSRALAGRARLAPRDSIVATALGALAAGDYPAACAPYAALVARDSLDFEAWFGLGECHARDPVVERDPASPSGWRFRSSYEAAVRAYVRAIEIVPSFQHALRAAAYSRLPSLLFAEPDLVRAGVAADGDSVWFLAEPRLQRDTLAFIPWRREEVIAQRPETQSPTVTEAVDRNRDLLYGLAVEWTRFFPRSADAWESLALALESGGDVAGDAPDRSARAALARARALASDPEQRLRLAVAEVRLRAKSEDFDGARGLADSLLAAPGAATPARARSLAGLALLTGRARRAAALLRRAEGIDTLYAWDGEPVRPPTPLAGHARALLAFAALGAPRDSIAALEREIARLAASRVEPAEQDRVRDALLYLPATLAFPDAGALPVHAARGRDFALLGAQRALAAGDTAAVRAFVRRVEEGTRRKRPGLVAIDASYQLAWLLRAIGDTAGASRRITLTLDALPTLTTAMLDVVPQAGAVGRAMALRAELAAATGDGAAAARWGRDVATLWEGADPELQPIVRRMRALAAGAPPR